MSARPNGGPAFPGERDTEHYAMSSKVHEEGMTLRDYFAAKAMQGMLADYKTLSALILAHDAGDEKIRATVAALSFCFADAMLSERAK